MQWVSVQGKQLIACVANDKIQVFKQKKKYCFFGKTCVLAMSLRASQYLKTFLMNSVVIWTNVIFEILYNKLCQHKETLYDSVNQYLPNDQCMMFQNNAWVKERSQVQDRQIYFLCDIYKTFIDINSNSTLQLIFINSACQDLDRNKENIHNYFKRLLKYSSLFQLHIWMRLDFLHILQPKEYTTKTECRSSYEESRCPLLSQTLKKFAKMQNNASFVTKFSFVLKSIVTFS